MREKSEKSLSESFPSVVCEHPRSSPSPARFHSGFPGSALLHGTVWICTKMWFSANILTGLFSCTAEKQTFPIQHLIILFKYGTPTGGYHRSHQREDHCRRRRTEGNQSEEAHFTPSAPLKDVSPFENLPLVFHK